MKQYGTIVADPPWPEKTQRMFAPDAREVEPADKAKDVEWPYHFMTLAEISALPVEQVAADKAHLYLWATQRSLRDAFAVCEAWGFVYKATLVWHKAGLGMGFHYYRHNAEFVLFGVRGNLATEKRNQGVVFRGTKRGHSVKPTEAFEMFEANSPGPRLEMFARAPRPGWDVWGNEVAPDLVLEGGRWKPPRSADEGENGPGNGNGRAPLRLAARLVPWDA